MKQTLAGRIMELGVLLSEFEGIEAHVLLHGNTGCLCVEIYEDKIRYTPTKHLSQMRAVYLRSCRTW